MAKRFAKPLAAVALAGLMAQFAPVSSGALFRETFGTDVVSEASFEATYPSLDFVPANASTTVSVVGGVATINLIATNTTSEIVVLGGGIADTHRITTLISAGNSGGGYNVGLRIGNNNIVFHPGLGGGALRVEGLGGFGNTNVGFTPANSTLHQLTVDELPGGQFNIRLVDGGNPSNVFTTSFTNAASTDGVVAFRRSGPGDASNRTGLFDALTITSGNTLFYSGFDLNVANAAQFTNANPDFVQNLAAGKTLDVTGGVARIGGNGNNNAGSALLTLAAPTGTDFLKISADIGATVSNGNFNVGLTIGGNNIVFHPGFGGGALRVEGVGGFGNTNVGFTPSNGVLHHLEVLEHASGRFDITFTDGLNSSNIFKTSFTNLASVGGNIGLHAGGPLSGQFGLYDNLLIEYVNVPEPATATLGLIGLAGLVMRRRRMA